MQPYDKRSYEDHVKVWEFSKKLTFFFMVIFSVHMSAFLVSAMFSLGNCTVIKESLSSSLPFYAVIFTGYTAKATFENYDKFKKQYELSLEKVKSGEENVYLNYDQYKESLG